MIYDVAVVGAGPAGSMVAYTAARRGLKALLIEEHGEVGRPCHCTGKLTTHAFREFDLPRGSILNSVRSAVFYSPSNLRLYVDRGEVDSYIIDRELFDRELAERAESAGAELVLGTRVLGAYRLSEGMLSFRARRSGARVEFKSRLAVDAEGVNPTLLDNLGLEGKREFLLGLQYQMADIDIDSTETVEVYLGRRIAPGFFAWIVPTSESEARVGLCVREGLQERPVRGYLDSFISDHPFASRKLKHGRVLKAFGGREPIGGPVERSFSDGVLVVGDSAGQVKSTSGGGIYFALKAAEIAGKVAAECLEVGEVHSRHLQRYEVNWKKALGDELEFTSTARRFIDSLTDRDLDRLFELMVREEGILRRVEKYGDTAYQSRLLAPLTIGFIKNVARRPLNLPLLSKLAVKALVALTT